MINLGKISNKGKDVILQEKENGCIECISHCKDADGYTRVFVNGKHERLFRYIYEQKYGKIPKEKVIRHKCDNAYCCNINHLEIGTQLDNVRDMISRNRNYKGEHKTIQGEKNVNHKLIEQQVKEIYLSNLSSYKLAKIYNVSRAAIIFIKNKKQWKWLTDEMDKRGNYGRNM